ncbi:MAG TPA: hypothetical protein VN493_07495 [Thermoanaerobaculia bacterium]|nr:hypothetical protein [Thermoanaerobaculia bacterium]
MHPTRPFRVEPPDGNASLNAVLQEPLPGGERIALRGPDRHARSDHHEDVALGDLGPEVFGKVVGHARLH